MSPETQTHYRACNLCEAICGLEIRTEDGSITSIRGDPDDPFSRGHICPKAVALQDIYQDPDRLKHPLRRTSNGWQRMSWDDAFDLAAERILAVRAEHGNDALAIYLGNPNVHNYGAMLFGPPLLRAVKTRNRFSATSIDQLPHHFAGYFMFGHQLLLPIPDLDRTDFLLMLGGNPAVSNGSLMTAPDVKKRLRAIRRRGGQVVLIDPRHTETAKLASRHHFVRPGTDALLLAALLHTLFEEHLESPGRLEAFTDGIEQIRRIAAEFSPERVAPAVGIDASDIRRLARDFAAAPSAACYGRIGVSVQEFGALCQWLINVINILTGTRPHGLANPEVIKTIAVMRASDPGRWDGIPDFSTALDL